METLEYFENVINEVWLSVYNMCNGNGVILYVVIPQFLMISTYWIAGILFVMVDITGRPQFIFKYRLPDPSAKNIPRITRSKLLQVVLQVAFNQIVVGSIFIYSIYFFKKSTIDKRGFETLKTQRFFGELLSTVLLEEVVFYYLHRMLHHPSLYKRFHKQHHEFTSPIAVTAIYCHPVEHILTNLLPVLSPWILIDTHVLHHWFWCAVSAPLGELLHCGYHLPFAQPPEFHHYHHMKFIENYGVLGFLDRLHETDKEYRKSEWFKRAGFYIPIDTAIMSNKIQSIWRTLSVPINFLIIFITKNNR